MGIKLWIKKFETNNKKDFEKQWTKFVDKEIMQKMTQYIKNQKKINDINFKENKNLKEPKKQALEYPNLYIMLGKDKTYYVNNENKWYKLTKEYIINKLYEIFLYSGIAYTFGEAPKEYGKYKFADMKAKNKKEAENYICNNHKKWDPAIAIIVGKNIIVGGWVAN